MDLLKIQKMEQNRGVVLAVLVAILRLSMCRFQTKISLLKCSMLDALTNVEACLDVLE